MIHYHNHDRHQTSQRLATGLLPLASFLVRYISCMSLKKGRGTSLPDLASVCGTSAASSAATSAAQRPPVIGEPYSVTPPSAFAQRARASSA